jgi:hypothetical protein
VTQRAPTLAISRGRAQFPWQGYTLHGNVTPSGALMMTSSVGQTFEGSINKGWWFVPNALSKFTVSPRNNLKANADGSTTLYFQHHSPGKDKEANWLPAPQGDFLPMLRMYWPKEQWPPILNGSRKPPAVALSN